ncbi:L-2-amino-thiazoline-4-carboxylic acid hydrolase [uncultured Ruminococcus sp.]|uniref:L-2-amino-thiazoline-4-carboxylic acid hydrolase n=1 Tax=uncultured Ruminococcus sp. TaxID=165186 RepID=UPI0025D3AA06|nr:L-2-amino-thiazoline-4-carboxylic acid hydrolase [uncultured Ruminococcus sp.]
MQKFIYRLTMCRSKGYIQKQYGKSFWKSFREHSDAVFRQVAAELPDIGNSIFSFNYAYAPSYVAWYRSMRQLGLDAGQADDLMWKMNEKMLLSVPKPFLHMAGKSYLNSFRKKAKQHLQRQGKPGFSEYDWLIDYRDIDANSFEIDIRRCGFITVAKKYGVEGMLPGICSVDYMVSHYMGNGFSRTKTLGDGDECCNCHYELTGKCPLRAPEGMK